MSAKYYKEDDLLVIKLSKKPYKLAEKVGSFIVHYTKDREPALLEILNASKLLKETSKALPKEVIRSIFTSAA